MIVKLLGTSPSGYKLIFLLIFNFTKYIIELKKIIKLLVFYNSNIDTFVFI
jgi:hypothetical protein